MTDGNEKNGLSIHFADDGELIIGFPEGLEDHTELYPSPSERKMLEAFMLTTVARSLIMRQRKREIHDPLTQLLRRDPGLQIIKERISRIAHMPFTGTVSILIIDLDHFKSVNDRYGHSVGDEVLRWSAEILRRRTRASDVAVRWGGEEFVVFSMAGIPPKCRGQIRDRDLHITSTLASVINNGSIVANRILQSFKAGPCMVGGSSIDQCATIGVATCYIASSDLGIEGLYEQLFNAADKKLIAAKISGERGQVHEANRLTL